MAFRRKLRSIWESLLRQQRLDRELDEELHQYLDDLIEKKIRNGTAPDAARREALLEMGGEFQVKAAVRRARIGAGVYNAWQDVRYALRSLIRRPAFAGLAILTFALGIGANTAIFSVVNTMLLRPLPYRDPGELVLVYGSAGYPRGPISGPELHDLRGRATLFEEFGAIWANTAVITGDHEPDQLRIGWVTANFFRTLGADAMIGRTFQEADEGEGARPTILLSWPVWQRRYGGDPSIVGKSIMVNGQSTEVIGVMSADFRLHFPRDASVPENLEAWLPFDHDLTGQRLQNFLRVVGRLKDGVPLAAGRSEVLRIAAEISREYADYGARPRIFVPAGLQVDGTRESRPALLALFGGVSLLLAIACLNVASLLVARAQARTKETAVRMAIGASRGQLFRQCLVEGLILAGFGGAAGLAFGEISLRAIVALRPDALSRLESAAIDTTALTFTAGTALAWGVLFSLAPMIEVIRTDVVGGVFGAIRRPRGMRHVTRSLLVSLQLAFSLVLLVGAGLMVRTFVSIQRFDPGYSFEQILSFRLGFPVEDFDFNDLHRRIEARLAALPGITGVGSGSHLPFDTIPNWGFPYFTSKGQDPATATFADYRSVSPGYLEAIGARLVEGRFFTEADRDGSLPVVIVDDLLARRSWPGETALGKQISVDPSVSGNYEVWATVVGVVRHMRTRSLVEDLAEQVFMPIRQVYRPTSYVAATTGDPTDIAPAIRSAIREVEPQIPLYDVLPLEVYVSRAKSTQRFTMFLAAAFAAIALALAFVGVFGLMSYAANTRRYEFGVRLALGAHAGEIVRLVLRESAWTLAIGLTVGLAGAATAAMLLESQLFGVTALDVPTYAVAVAAMGAAGLLASWLPARKASATNPLDVIKS